MKFHLSNSVPLSALKCYSANHINSEVQEHINIGRLDPSDHNVHIFLEYHSVRPFVGIGSAPTPLPQAGLYSSPHPPEPKGREARSPAGEGVGEFQFERLEKSPSTLSTLCFRS
jgi:hypothetical protein